MLGDVLRPAGDRLSDVSCSIDTSGGLVWDRAGRPFATLRIDGRAAGFRLDRAVAVAALRTPDTTVSSRGADWIEFGPSALDDHAVDRAEAWFASAWRRAEHA